MSAAVFRRVAAGALVLSIGLLTAACSSGGSGGTAAAGNSGAGAGTASASPVSDTTTSGATVGSSASASASAHTTAPCSLLTAAAAKSIGLSLGSSRTVTTGDLSECVYDDAGPLIVAVLDEQFTKSSFESLISTQDNGPYASTTGKSASVPGLGDAAYSYAKTGIVEVLEGSTVISVTASDLATAEKVAKAVLPSLG